MSITFNETVTLEKIVCGSCGITFAMPETMLVARRKEAGSFYCPNGHRWGWKETEADRLRKQLEETQIALRKSKCETLNEQTKRVGVEFEKSKLEKKLHRSNNGVCTFCGRTFQNLMRHMKSKHPDKL
jgi:hypothetical protein